MKPLVVLAGLLTCCVVTGEASRTTAGAAPDTIRVLWRDPGSIGARDLFWGAASADRAPKPPFTFVQENTSGTKPKIEVKDAAGVPWSVKLATAEMAHNEVHAEVAASRLVWALGYFVEEHYFVPQGKVDGVKDLKRAASLIGADGSFRTARFERRTPELEKRGQWHVENNPFKGTRELSGLHTLLILLANWDAQPTNAAIVRVPLPNGNVEERYLLSDLGTAFGRMKGGVERSPSRWNLQDYTEARFLAGVNQGRLVFRHPLLGNEPLAVPLDHAKWFVGLVSQLSDQQVRRAFEAAGASAEDVAGFSTQFMKRVGELKAAVEK